VDSSRISAIPLFAELAVDDLAFVAGIASEIEVPEGANLALEGDFGYAAQPRA
jgi:hypothetical protein